MSNYPISKQIDHPAFHDLKTKGIGRSITGENISAIHGDLFTELFNKRPKVLLVCFVLDSDIDALNCGFKTIHIRALLRKELHKCLHMKTGSKHKKLTSRGIKTNVEHVKNLKQKLCGCDIDHFSNDALRHLPTGKIIEATFPI